LLLVKPLTKLAEAWFCVYITLASSCLSLSY